MDLETRIGMIWWKYGVHKLHRQESMMNLSHENKGKGNEVGDHNHADTLIAVIKTLAAKYQRCVHAKQSVTPTAKHIDAECVTAGSQRFPPHISNFPSPSSLSCITWTDISHTMLGPIGQISTCSTCSTPLLSSASCDIPPLSCTARYDMSKHVENSVNPPCRPSMFSPALPSQIATLETSRCALPHPSLTSQDVKTELLSIVTDSILDTWALLENVSLINEIKFVLVHPTWVKCGVTSAGAISSNVILLFRIFTRNLRNIFSTQILGQKIMDSRIRAICPLFYIILWILHSSSVIGSPNRLPINYLPDMDMAINAVPV